MTSLPSLEKQLRELDSRVQALRKKREADKATDWWIEQARTKPPVLPVEPPIESSTDKISSPSITPEEILEMCKRGDTTGSIIARLQGIE
jgi:hypothetical protein